MIKKNTISPGMLYKRVNFQAVSAASSQLFYPQKSTGRLYLICKGLRSKNSPTGF